MGIYNFQPRFVPMILNGTKTHTIRGERKRPDRPGDTFYGYSGLRTKAATKLIEAPIVRVDLIVMERARLWIADQELKLDEKNLFAWRDGFRYDASKVEAANTRGCFDLMLEFWIEKRKTTDFMGHVIHWSYAERRREHRGNARSELQQ